MSRGRVGRALALALALGSFGCEDVTHRDIGDEINILVRRDDALVAPATERLARYQRAAIPQIETAMHTAAPTGRLHLIAALARIGDVEASPVLRHVAVYDVTPEVRRAAEKLLSDWSRVASDGRTDIARQALEDVARWRAAGEGPLLFGDAGVPGAPTTVGAPEPVGAPPH
ncbi:MAG TPA: HEAT repeat domain-containing protein [Polyangia bacterium]|nr:HEAT repeat domain-containing protein [Polyangia bacterium]